jgi:molybdopterin-containing oxidoreductase family iron-sulfur binding subunit
VGKEITQEPLDLAAIRGRLAGTRGKEYWRSLDELAATAEFQEFLHREFPRQAAEWNDPNPLSRRQFLKLMAASLALAGLSGCQLTEPQEKIVPYVNKPEQLVPGIPLFYATAMPLGGYATGLLVRSNEGRPTKVEGNPDHPASLGATDVFAQASILSLYDPDRSQTVTNAGQASNWEAFLGALNSALAGQRANGGAGLRVLTETVTSPTLIAQMQALLAAFPSARWYQYEPGSGDAARAGARQAFGQDVHTTYRFDQANVILSLDSNFLLHPAGRVRYGREFIAGRLVRDGRRTMNRLYVVASRPTITGAMADHHLPMRASQIEAFARAIVRELGIDPTSAAAPAVTGAAASWVTPLVRDLQANRGRGLVIAGEEQPAAVHALAHAINDALGNVGTTVLYTAPIEANPGDQLAGLRELTDDMAAGRVGMLLILGANPAYTAPADIGFAEAFGKVPFRAHMGLYADETAALSQWHIPEAHYLESWSDARAYDGTATIIQPLIAPLYGGKTVHELVAALLGQNASSFDIVRGYWQSQRGGATAQPSANAPTAAQPNAASAGATAEPSNIRQQDPFEEFWVTALNKGIVDGTALPAISATIAASAFAGSGAPLADQGLEITFGLDPTIWDGRFGNNGWLQELHKPLTSLTWDNVAMVSSATAERLGLQSQDLVELSYKGRTVRAPIWIQPGQPDDSVAVTLGYGRTKGGQTVQGVGFNAYALRTADAPGFGAGLEIRKTGQQYKLASVQRHFSMEGRGFVQSATLDEFLKNPGFVHGEEPQETQGHTELPSLYPEYEYKGNKWGMVIDTNACIGCNACVVACQSENNIPVVGKDQVLNTREMHWLKIDQYYTGNDLDNPEMFFEPRLCMHCEKAPCELVCPVAATMHDHEGLNVMVYNRCVGTRYCSNNCPYKVRRFNYLTYTRKDIPVLQLMQNPEVTVRNRGVMEKCTYCVQRISNARIASDREDRPIRDGEVLTACQQACPTNAIVFGNINDQGSQVAKLKAEASNYGLLEDLNTQPRTTYLPRIRNPNPEIKE